MELVNRLRNKKIIVTEIPQWGAFLRKQWEDNFANHISPNEKKNIFLNDSYGYLWHLFSYEKITFLQGEEANCVDDLMNEIDIYIVDKEFKWTYIKTHETGYLGPYFSLRDERV